MDLDSLLPIRTDPTGPGTAFMIVSEVSSMESEQKEHPANSSDPEEIEMALPHRSPKTNVLTHPGQ